MSRLRESRPPMRPRLVVCNPGVQLSLPLVAEALPLARQLELMATAMGPESERVAHELVEILEGDRPLRPRRVA